MSLTLLRAADRAAQPWRNGGGVTFEIAREEHPARAGEFAWRLSIAEVTVAGEFSRFEHCERLIAVVDGRGMTLRFGARSRAAGQSVALEPAGVVRFHGEDEVFGELPLGAVRDLNVIYDPAVCGAELTFRDGPRVVETVRARVIAVNVSPAPVRWRSAGQEGELARFDALTGAPAQLTLPQGARVALVSISRRS